MIVLPGVPSTRNKVFYECCPAPYLDITFTIRQWNKDNQWQFEASKAGNLEGERQSIR